MILSELLPESIKTPPTGLTDIPLITDKLMSLSTTEPEIISTNDTQNSIAPIKIPLVSFEPILATSPEYVLTNERTKRKNHLVLFDQNLKMIKVHLLLEEPVLDALWYEKQNQFLLLTSSNVLEFNPNTKHINVLRDLSPMDNKNFQCFTLLNGSILLIAYDEWSAENIDKWEQDDENGSWKLIERKSLKLTCNEFLGKFSTTVQDDGVRLATTICNNLLEEWRIEIRDIETLTCIKTIALPEFNLSRDYNMVSFKNNQSGIKMLAFSSANANIIAIDANWKKIHLNYKNPVQRMAIFQDNYLIVRTTERVDVHSFI